ncbi:MAG: formimidoylglutamate deiminase, partial [Acetobacteraceae bacterium]
MILHVANALLPEGWAKDVRIRIEEGRIAEVTPGVPGQGYGVILPAPVNLHSHTFQRAMAGLTEARTAGQDSFWTWRSLMYRFLDRLTPDDIQAIAAQAMVEMAESGFSANCEFHYLHHPVGGGTYAQPAEMSARIAEAARQTGLGLTHLPVIYEQGGVDGRALAGGQLRFGSTPEVYASVLDGAAKALAGMPDAVLGVAPHSLRAVSRGTLDQVAGMTDGPVHIHIAEQVAEVTEVQAAWGARPVEWAVANLPLDPR